MLNWKFSTCDFFCLFCRFHVFSFLVNYIFHKCFCKLYFLINCISYRHGQQSMNVNICWCVFFFFICQVESIHIQQLNFHLFSCCDSWWDLCIVMCSRTPRFCKLHVFVVIPVWIWIFKWPDICIWKKTLGCWTIPDSQETSWTVCTTSERETNSKNTFIYFLGVSESQCDLQVSLEL